MRCPSVVFDCRMANDPVTINRESTELCLLPTLPPSRSRSKMSLSAITIIIVIDAVIGLAIYLLRRLKPKDPPDKFDG